MYCGNVQGESKKRVICGAWCKIVTFCATLLYGGFLIFFENLYFFWSKKIPRTFFSFKIKSSEKQKCVNKFFVSKSKILKRLDHRIP